MIRWLLLLCLPARALVCTNLDENVLEPPNPNCGWRFVAENAAWTACGPRLVCSVQHVFPPSPVFGGQTYNLVLQILPPGTDIRFGVVDRDLPGYAAIYVSTNGWPPLDKLWLVAGGVGCGNVVGGTNFYWGAEGQWPAGSRRLRWGYSGSAFMVPGDGLDYFVWRTDQCGSASGDSGYAAFTADGRFLGPVRFGDNPVVLGANQSGGKLAGRFLDWIKPYLPTNGVPVQPPKPKTVSSVKIEAKP